MESSANTGEGVLIEETSTKDSPPSSDDGVEEGDASSCNETSDEKNDSVSQEGLEDKIESITINGNDDDDSDGSVILGPTDISNLKESKGSEGLKDANDNEGTTLKTIVCSSKWSETLQSPVNDGRFSPSEPGSNHGLGLRLARERNISTALFLGNISMFLSKMAAIYEHAGINLVKISGFLSPDQFPFKTSIDSELQTLHKTILCLGGDFRNSAECYRTTIVASLQTMLATSGNERDSAIKKYNESRQACVDARKEARSDFQNGKEAVKAAELDIHKWVSKLKRNSKGKTDDDEIEEEKDRELEQTDLPWERTLKLIGKKGNEMESTMTVIDRLKNVETCNTHYIASIEKEKNLVKLAEEKETLALNKAQNAEEAQINFFLQSVLTNIFPKETGEAKFQTFRSSPIKSSSDRPFGIEKKTTELFSTLNLFKQNLPYEEGMGVMDAETLGLPPDLGIQRDKVKSCFSARKSRIEVSEMIVGFFEECTNFMSSSSMKMRSQISSQRRKEAAETASDGSLTKSKAGELWHTALAIFEDEAKVVSGVGFKLTKLEKWLSTCKRNLETEADLDDAAWKQVCDAARTEMRLEAKYKQTRQQVERVRQRASSRELSLSRPGSSDSSEDNTLPLRKRNDSSGTVNFPLTPSKVGRSFLKGGEALFKGGEAMKKLTENAITQIAQRGMNEADQKEAKDQLALQESTAAKQRAISTYTSYTEDRIERLNSEDECGWDEMKEIINKLIESLNALIHVRSHVFETRISRELDAALSSIATNLTNWANTTGSKILETSVDASSDDKVAEYALNELRINSDNIDQLLRMTPEDTTLPDLVILDVPTIEDTRDIDVQKNEMISTSDKNGTTFTEQSKIRSTTERESVDKVFDTTVVHSKTVSPKTNYKVQDVVELKPEIMAFKKQFWSKKPKEERMPHIIQNHTCAYRPKERVPLLTQSLSGRLYTTKDAIYFLAADKNFTLRWEKITAIEKEKGFMGTNNETDLIISYRSENQISSFLLCRFHARDKVLAHLQSLKIQSEADEVQEEGASTGRKLPPVAPDALLNNEMDIVVSKTMKNVSVTSVFNNVWADKSEGKSFYESWLGEEECFDITMEEWKIAGSGVKFKNEWCGEQYDQERLVTFKFNRTTHLYIGPPVAFVKQRHFIRVEGNDRCVLAISAEFEGIPYADTFGVEMRWIATRKGTSDIHVQVGLFVNFKKKTMLKSQIKSGTIDETKNVHLRLFDAVKKACKPMEGDGTDDDVNDEDDNVEDDIAALKKTEPGLLLRVEELVRTLDLTTVASSIGLLCLAFAGSYFTRTFLGSSRVSETHRLEVRIQELQDEVRSLHKSMDLITTLLQDLKRNCNDTV